MQIIAVSNPKGGCGKTTTAIHLAAALAELGHRVLLVDLDPQAHTTLSLGRQANSPGQTVFHVMANEPGGAPAAIFATAHRQLDLMPGDERLGQLESRLASIPGKELILGEQLRGQSAQYDFCVIDCPPSHGLLMTAALVASTAVVVPVQLRPLAATGLAWLAEAITGVRRRFHPCVVRPLGLLPTFAEGRTILSRKIESDLRAAYGSLVFEAVVPRTVALAEAPATAQSVLTYAPKSKAAAAYRTLAREAMKRLDTPGSVDLPKIKSLSDIPAVKRQGPERRRVHDAP